jgi:23S rRNA (guanosine2251-2'-O)-methyltransferase
MKENKLSVFGLHAVESLISNHPERILRLFVLHDRQDKKVQAILDLAKQARLKVDFASRAELDHMCHDANHQGVVALSQQLKNYSEKDLDELLENLNEPAFLLILDGVQDPHNLGAILRTADAAGVHAVIAPKDKAVGITATVSKVACGAAETIPFIQVTNLARMMESLKERNIWIYGAAGEAKQTLYQTKLKGSIAIVMGAEGDGLRRLTRDLCDVLLNIPMHGSVSSLNVSVATGVFLFEAVRQRL